MEARHRLWQIRIHLHAFRAANLAFKALRRVRAKARLVEILSDPLFKILEPRFRTFERSDYANLLFVWAMQEALAAVSLENSSGLTVRAAGGYEGRIAGHSGGR